MTKIEQLLIAAVNGNTQVVTNLIQTNAVAANAGLDVASEAPELKNIPKGTTALMLAAGNARLQIIKFLLGFNDYAQNTQPYLNKADIFAKNADGKHVLDFILNSAQNTEEQRKELDQIAIHIIEFCDVLKLADLQLDNVRISALFQHAVSKGMYQFVVKLIDLGVDYTNIDGIVSAAIGSDSLVMVNLFVLGKKINSTQKSLRAERTNINKIIVSPNDLKTAISSADADIIKSVFNSLSTQEQNNFSKLEIIVAVLQRRTQMHDTHSKLVQLSSAVDHGNATNLLREWFPTNKQLTINTDFKPVLFAAAAAGVHSHFFDMLSRNYSVDFKILDDNGKSLLDIAFENNAVNSIKPLHDRYREIYKEAPSWFQTNIDRVKGTKFTFWYQEDKIVTCSLLAFAALTSDKKLLEELWDLDGYTFNEKNDHLKQVLYDAKTVLELLREPNEDLDPRNASESEIVKFLRSKKVIHPAGRLNSIPEETTTKTKGRVTSTAKLASACMIFSGCTSKASDDGMMVLSTQTISSSTGLQQGSLGSGSAWRKNNTFASSDPAVQHADSAMSPPLGSRDFRSSSPIYTPGSMNSTPFSYIGSRVSFQIPSQVSSTETSRNTSRAQSPDPLGWEAPPNTPASTPASTQEDTPSNVPVHPPLRFVPKRGLDIDKLIQGGFAESASIVSSTPDEVVAHKDALTVE